MSKQPNIVFILIDDMGWKDLTCQGSTFYETPNIDQLAAKGMTFTDAYASCPVCSPTRASIMAGKYPANVGVTDWIAWNRDPDPTRGHARGRLIDAPYVDHLPEHECSLGRALGEGGYQTWHVGKWHLGGPGYWPDEHGFDVNVGGCHHGSPGRGGYFSPWTIPALEDVDVPDGTYLDDYLTDQAMELIRNRDADRPFYLNLWYYLVHTPIQAKQELIDKYTAKAERLGIDQDAALVPGEFHPADHKRDVRIVRRIIQSDPVYAAMVEILDQNVGKVMRALEEAGIADDTVILFTSDNGGLSTSEGSPTCNFPLHAGKGWMYEGGTREPMLVHWPGVTRRGSQCSTPITSPDVYPTVLEIAGLDPKPEQHADGVSFTALLRDPTTQLDREAIYWHYPHYGNQGGTPGSSVRCGDWKLIEFFEDGRLELYNLRHDISESHNLADAEPDRTKKLHAMLKDWRESCEAKIPQVNPDYAPPEDPEADPRV